MTVSATAVTEQITALNKSLGEAESASTEHAGGIAALLSSPRAMMHAGAVQELMYPDAKTPLPAHTQSVDKLLTQLKITPQSAGQGLNAALDAQPQPKAREAPAASADYLDREDQEKAVEIRVEDVIYRNDESPAVVLAIKRTCSLSGEEKTGNVTLGQENTLRLYLET